MRYPALRAEVELEMDRRGWEVADLAQHSQIAPNTLRKIGINEPQANTVRGLRVLGLTPARVDELKAAGWLAGNSAYSRTTLTIAALCAGMPAWRQAIVLDLVQSMIRHAPLEQSD